MSARGRTVALILAAGYSFRMGTMKPLLPVGRSTAMEEAVKRFQAAGIDDIRVVVGHRSNEIVPVIEKLKVKSVLNPDYDQGMLSSVLAGVRSFESEIEAFFLLPADIPLVKPATIAALARTYRTSAAKIVYPCFLKHRGHPPLISTACMRDLSNDCEGSVRSYLRRFESQALDLDVVDQSVLMDCNTIEEYRKLQAYGLREDVPTEQECEAIWNIRQLPEHVRAHSRLVAEFAGTLALHLNRAGFDLDIDLVAAGGCLHDLAKGEPDHARAGAEWLEKLGYPKVARIVAFHTDIVVEDRGLDETALVHLADKYVQGARFVTLEDRFDGPLKKFALEPHILKAVEKRFRQARIIRDRVEECLRSPVEEIIQKCGKSMRMAVKGGRSRVYLVRHGDVGLAESEKRYIGQADLHLSPDGVRQAQTLRERLEKVPLEAVYCSDLARSRETACIIAEPHGLEPVLDPNLREIGLGDWEGISFDEIRRLYPEAYDERGRDLVHFRPPGGESFLDCASRVIPALHEALLATSGNILVVGHAGVNRILLCQAMGKSMDTLMDIRQDYGCLNLLRYGDFALELETLNETAQPRRQQS
jgi:molybdenum cofactor cytidylyltransferase